MDFVVRGLRQTVDEREERRAQLRLDADVVGRRRRTFRMGALMLLGAALLARGAFAMRTGSNGQYNTPLPGVLMLFSGLWLFGFGLVLVTRSPMRMGIWERLFRVVWLGAAGRAFLRSAANGTERAGSVTGAVPGTTRAVATRAVAAPVALTTVALTPVGDDVGDARLAALESRVARLEQKLDVS